MKIIQHNTLLDDLTSRVEQNQHFQKNLEILKARDSVRGLSIYNEYDDEEYRAFRLLSTTMEEEAAYGSEPFSGSFLGLLKKM